MHYTAHQKLNLLCALDELQLRDGLSIRAAAKKLQTSRVILARWKRDRDVLYTVKKKWMKKKALVDGPTGCLDPIKDDLLRWIFELRECGHAVDRAMVSTKASVLNHSFGEKSDAAKYAAVKRFLDCISLVYRM